MIIDHLCLNLDQALRTLFGKPITTERSNPAEFFPESLTLTTKQQRAIIGIMRVNHSGEVCAQALYHGQALTARDESIRKTMHNASIEENDHLIWCEQRLIELNGHTSFLNPLLYIGSLTIGIVAGLFSDTVNLSFLAETERQVVQHLNSHLERLPYEDQKSRAILNQMKTDESKHATQALNAGGIEFPSPIPLFMRGIAKIMTTATYYV